MGDALRALADGLKSVFKWWVIIAPWEQGLRIRGGKHVKLMEAGVHFRIPFWDRVYVQPTRLRITDCNGQTLTTQDGKTLVIQLLLAMRVDDLLQLYENLHDPSATAEAMAMQAASEFVEEHEAQYVTSEALSQHVSAIMESKLANYGLVEASVSLANFVYTPKAYRFITGEAHGWIDGGVITMGDDADRGGLR